MKILKVVPVNINKINSGNKLGISVDCDVTYKTMFRKPQTKLVTMYYEGQINNKIVNPYLIANGFSRLANWNPTFSDIFHDGFYLYDCIDDAGFVSTKQAILSDDFMFVMKFNFGIGTESINEYDNAFAGWNNL